MLKKYLFLFVILLFLSSVPASAKMLNLYPIKKNGNIGFVDKTGKIVIEPALKLEGWGFFYEGLNKAKINGKWGFIDTSGKIAIEPKFEDALSFLPNGTAPAKENGKWGFIDKTGKWVVEPRYDNIRMVTPFPITETYILTKDKKEGIANSLKIIEPAYDKVSFAFGSNDDKYEFARIEVKQNSSKSASLFGYLNVTTGKTIPPQFFAARDFSEGLAAVQREKDGKWGFIDKTGQWVIAPQFISTKNLSQGLAAVQDSDKKWGFIDKTGKWVITPQFIDAYQFSADMACAKKDKDTKFGFIDKTGKWVIEPRFTTILSPYGFTGKLQRGFSQSGLAIVYEDKKGYGVINKEGKYIINPIFESVSVVNDEIIVVQRIDIFGYLLNRKESYLEGCTDMNGKFLRMDTQLYNIAF